MRSNLDFTHEQKIVRRPHSVAPTLANINLILVVQAQTVPAYGSGMGLSITSLMTSMVLRRAGVECHVWTLASAEQLKQKLSAYEYAKDRPITHVVINTPGFIGPLDYGILATSWPDINFVMLNHTGLAYLSIDHDGWRNIEWDLSLQISSDNVFVAGNNPRFAASILAQDGVPALWLPNLYDTTTFRPLRAPRTAYSPLRIGSFAEGRPWKNQLVAAQAALAIARDLDADLELYVNQDRWVETRALSEARRQLFENRLPQAKLIEVPWQSWSLFLRTVESMDLLLYASFDEAFGMIPADGLAVGVPSVTSGALEWTPHTWQAPNVWDPASLTIIGLALLHGRLSAVQSGREALANYVKLGIERWKDFLVS
jgi:glycosyltransferase involved in cell wall biosynthesis